MYYRSGGSIRAMSSKPVSGRWDGWDDPDYKPTEDELNEPIAVDATPEELAAALMKRRG